LRFLGGSCRAIKALAFGTLGGERAFAPGTCPSPVLEGLKRWGDRKRITEGCEVGARNHFLARPFLGRRAVLSA